MSLEAKIEGRKGVYRAVLVPIDLKRILEAEKFRVAIACGTTPAYHDLIREWHESHLTLEKQRAEMKQCQDAA